MEIPNWLLVINHWIVTLSPIWVVLIAILWKPIRLLSEWSYQYFFKKPVAENKDDISEHDKRLNKIDRKLNELEDELQQRRRISKALLHHEIFQTAREALKKQHITEYELENLEELYIPYKEIGGNGTAEKLYNDCKELPILK